LLLYGAVADMEMPFSVYDAGWNSLRETGSESFVVDAGTQAQWCAVECSAMSGCLAFAATYSSGSCRLMAANNVEDLTPASGTDFYFVHTGELIHENRVNTCAPPIRAERLTLRLTP
jgi:hypothetical protein